MDRKEEQNQERNGQKEIFAGKVAVVTGASRGIGRAIALELARKGAMVVINYNGSEERAQEVQKKKEMKQPSCSAMYLTFRHAKHFLKR